MFYGAKVVRDGLIVPGMVVVEAIVVPYNCGEVLLEDRRISMIPVEGGRYQRAGENSETKK